MLKFYVPFTTGNQKKMVVLTESNENHLSGSKAKTSSLLGMKSKEENVF